MIRGHEKVWLPRGGSVASGATLLDRVLKARSLDAPGVAEGFLSPVLRHLHDPSLMTDVEKAANRIVEAIRLGQPIVIYGDYDVDGITATTILYHTIKALRPDASVSTYVPHRMEEGYGLNLDALRELCGEGAKLIISVDCGVTAKGHPEVCRELGADLIITDHHNPPASREDLPDAYAVVHPRHPEGNYPFGDLCGAGVAYKLAWRLCTLWSGSQRVPKELQELLLDLLGPCALGVIADVVPLVGENRVIVANGLSRIRHSRIPGLRELVKASRLAEKKVSETDVGFKLAPRLNACGRLGHAKDAVELFTTAVGPRAVEIAQALDKVNDTRKDIEKRIFEQAAAMAEAKGMTGDDRRAIVLASPDWHQGVVGIVCSRLTEKYHRPAILMAERDGHLHGSGRSIDGFDLHAAIMSCGHLLTKAGGHLMAAGVGLDASNLEAFTEAFTKACNEGISVDRLVARRHYDCEAAIADLTVGAMADVAKLGPFGRDHPEVTVVLRGVTLRQRAGTMGDGSHLTLFVMEAANPRGAALRLIAWRRADLVDVIPVGVPIDVLIKPSRSDYSGNVEGELIDFAS